MTKKFTFLNHMADIKIRLQGKSLSELFESVTSAFAEYVGGDQSIKTTKKKTITLTANDNESLMYAYIDELLYLLDAEDFVAVKATVKIKDTILTAVLQGDATKNYHLNHIKAATYAEMKIEKNASKWTAEVVLDV